MRRCLRRCTAASFLDGKVQIIHSYSFSGFPCCLAVARRSSVRKRASQHEIQRLEVLRIGTGVLLSALQACGKLAYIEAGKKIHGDVLQNGIHANVFVANTLISMYAKSRCLKEAAEVFHGIPVRNVVSWNNLMLGFAENGQEEHALELFRCIPRPNPLTFVAAAKACSGLSSREPGKKDGEKVAKPEALELAKEIHSQAAKAGCDSELFVASTLIDMFAKCGSMEYSQEVFSKATDRDEACWNSLMLGYVQNGEERRALDLFLRMEAEGYLPNGRSFVAALKACSGLAAKEEKVQKVDGEFLKPESLLIGMSLHARASNLGYEFEGFVASTLIDMYAICGSLQRARLIFDRISSHSQVSWNCMIRGYVGNHEEEQALHLFSRMEADGFSRDSRSFVAALKACSGLAHKESGKQVQGQLVKVCALENVMGIHRQAQAANCHTDIFVGSSLVDGYSKCASMLDARKVFDGMVFHTVITWTALILGYADNNCEELALELFARMQAEGCTPNVWTFIAALKACGSLAAKHKADEKYGKATILDLITGIKMQAMERGLDSDVFLLSTLVDVYSMSGSMEHARAVFDAMPKQDIVAWNALILGYTENKDEDTALQIFATIPEECRDSLSYVAALKACTRVALKEEAQHEGSGIFIKPDALKRATSVHAEATKGGFDLDVFVATTLVDTYAKCGSMKASRRVYDRLPAHNAALWTALLLGYVEQWEEARVLQLLDSMPSEADSQTLVAALKACASLAITEESKLVDGKPMKVRALEKGTAVHHKASKCGRVSDDFVANTLVDMYVKCWSLADAQRVFDSMKRRSVVAWNALIMGYTKAGEASMALELLASMNCVPDVRTFIAALKACAAQAARETGSQVDGKLVKLETLERAFSLHRQSAELGCDLDVFLASSLMEVYARCGAMIESIKVFVRMPWHNVLTWNALMLGYVENGHEELALELLHSMEAEESCKPDAQTFVAALKACASLAAKEEGEEIDGKLVKIQSLEKGKAVHSAAVKNGYGLVRSVAGLLVTMYSRCRSLRHAREVFDKMDSCSRDVVLWNALILGYVENNEEKLALELFAAMQEGKGSRPDAGTYVAALKACGNSASVASAKEISAEITRYAAENFVTVANCLVDVFGKCGSMIDAQLVFDSLPARDSVAWNSLIAGYSHHGSPSLVFSSFHQMRDEEIEVNAITFVSVLTACSHAGLVDKAQRYFAAMTPKYGIRATIEHYHCLIDALGRADQLDAAVALIGAMSPAPTLLTWLTIVGQVAPRNAGSA